MPAVEVETGRLLLAEPGSLFLSPDGHGGMLAAFDRSGGMDDAQGRGVELLFYGQVDNPLLQICDPLLLGYHLLAESEMTTQVVQKASPLERVGNVAEIDGQTCIIEYSDLPDDVARRTNPDGTLWLWAGNLAVHVFAVEFLDRVSDQADVLPFHRARKKADFVDSDGQVVSSTTPNAIKFERFIFDLLPAARNAIVVESVAAEAFAPVKNASDAATDTAETARRAMIQRDTRRLRQAGVEVAEGVAVEINPRWALDADDVARKIQPGLQVTQATYFSS
jgi:UDP-N-acetylglucosamine/UDP-N-acetylgalactosamine diphosphorylase